MVYPIYPCGDRALTLQIGSEISPEVNRQVAAVSAAICAAGIAGVVELVPTYTSVCVHYDPMVLSYSALQQKLLGLRTVDTVDREQKDIPVVEIPVCYGGEYGPDLAYVAQYNQLTPEEVIARHSSGEYLVYMLGFLPGFAYLGGMDEKIACPRLETPRTKIPAGSVGIAGSQTGIYPLDSPGGWQLIGRTPMRMFRMAEEQGQFALSAGDRVRFVPISEKCFREMEAAL